MGGFFSPPASAQDLRGVAGGTALLGASEAQQVRDSGQAMDVEDQGRRLLEELGLAQRVKVKPAAPGEEALKEQARPRTHPRQLRRILEASVLEQAEASPRGVPCGSMGRVLNALQ